MLADTNDDDQLVRAVQYLRMSSEQQRYSMPNQASAIAEYAKHRGYEIVASYLDAGRSGLSLKGRDGLKQLLTAVLRPQRDFDAILVHDVSRWGRFQDPDQAAHYEFLCRQAGLIVAYCAEPFENDLSPMSNIAKHLKRVMAGEFSRELSEKVTRAHLQQASLGFHQGGPVPYGFRRMLIDEHGRPKFLLKHGQRKALHDDHVVPVYGPPEEQTVIKKIFRWYAEQELRMPQIAEKLRKQGVSGWEGLPFTTKMVDTVLRSELCIGVYVYNRRTTTLQSSRRKNPEQVWTRVHFAKPLVSPKQYRKVQELIASRHRPRTSKPRMLRALRQLLKRKGYLSHKVINKSPTTPDSQTYVAHFGSLSNACALIGWKRPSGFLPGLDGVPWSDEALIAALRRLHNRLGYISHKAIIRDPDLPSSVYVLKRFGSLQRVYALCGFPIENHKALMRAVADRHQAKLAAGTEPVRPRGRVCSSREMISGLRKLVRRYGYLSARLINDHADIPSTTAYLRRFGSLHHAYELAGWSRTRSQIQQESAERRCRKDAGATVSQPIARKQQR